MRSEIVGKGSREAMSILKAWRDEYIAAATAEADAQNEEPAGVGGMHTKKFMDYYWSTRNISQVTRDGYERQGRLLAHKTLDKPVADLTPADVQAWLDAMRAGEMADHEPTLVNTLKQLKYGLRWAVRMGYIDKSGAEAVPVPKVRAGAPNPLIDEAKRQKLVDALATMRHGTEGQKQLGIAASLALYTGMRLGEICALRWRDIDGGADGTIAADGEIHVQRALTEPSGGPVIKDYPKSGKRRDIPMTSNVATILIERRSDFSEQKNIADKYVVAVPLLSAEPPSRSSIEKPWRALATTLALEGAEGRPLRLHDLRHTWATRSLAGGADDVAVASVLGHEKVATTKTYYARWTRKGKERAMKAAE